jgi:dihydrofolate reductase
MEISVIVAVGQNNEIGKNNNLLWRIRDDLRLFKQTTNQHVVIHGRKSFESIGKPLPNRTNVIITRNKAYAAEGAFTVHSLDEAIALAKKLEINNEIFILGGAEIYNQALPLATNLYMSFVDATFPDADAYFPDVKWEDWKEQESNAYQQSEHNQFSFVFKKFTRI